ncbi:hypothetical protein HZA97_03775 [Candidatus Woesearchaeota archaeon]|nr:hypothetical protein [Candidatus Woesearchaeota archaeon]
MTSAFLEVVGESPVFKVLDFLTVNDDFDYSMTDIAKLSEVGYSTLKLFWPKLEEEKLVIPTRVVGKAKMYKLNYQNIAVKKFKEFYWAITKEAIGRIKEKTAILA